VPSVFAGGLLVFALRPWRSSQSLSVVGDRQESLWPLSLARQRLASCLGRAGAAGAAPANKKSFSF